MQKEYKFIKFSEIKQLSEGSFEGYAATFGNVDLVGDVIEKGAFSASLAKSQETKLYLDHDYRFANLLGKAKVWEDEKGLVLQKSLDVNDPLHQAVYRRLKDGSLDSMSIGFVVSKSSDGQRMAEYRDGIRYIKQVDLMEVSLVAFPANPQAKIETVKSIREEYKAWKLKDFEDFLRESGISKADAVAIASKGFKAIQENRSESDIEESALGAVLTELKNFNEGIECLNLLRKSKIN